MRYALVEVSETLALRLIAESGRISSLIESDAVTDALEAEVVADCKQKHQERARMHGTVDLELVKRSDPRWMEYAALFEMKTDPPDTDAPVADAPADDDIDDDDSDVDTPYMSGPD